MKIHLMGNGYRWKTNYTALEMEMGEIEQESEFFTFYPFPFYPCSLFWKVIHSALYFCGFRKSPFPFSIFFSFSFSFPRARRGRY